MIGLAACLGLLFTARSRAQVSYVQQPVSVSGYVGGSIDMSFIASIYGSYSSVPISIQRFDAAVDLSRFTIISQQYGTNLVGTTNVTTAAFTVRLNNATAADAGTYSFLVQSPANTLFIAQSQKFTISVTAAAPPSINASPVSTIAAMGGSVSFSVGQSGTTPFTYQWSFNGVPIPNAVNASYSIGSLLVANAGTYAVTVSNSAGSATSASANLTIVATPTLTTSQGQTIVLGSAATLSEAATGSGPFTYQWLFNGTIISGATASIYTIPAVAARDLGSYAVAVANPTGSVTSPAVAVAALVAPAITVQPHANGFAFGSSDALSVGASAQTALTYQWLLNGVAIPGATNSIYTVNAPGSYTVAVTNAAGTTVSAAAVESVTNRLVNISSRAQVGVGGNILIPGFVVTGDPSAAKQLLVRGIGPALSTYGVSGPLLKPTISIYDAGGKLLASNSGWDSAGNSAQIAAVAAQVGAFALPAGAADCAVLASLPAGAYSVQLSGLNSTTGIALAEVYEVSGTDGAQLSNIASRAQVTAGTSLITGFVVGGSQPAKVLLRADGPVLAQYGVSVALPQPVLTVNNATGALVATNAGWGGNANAAQIAATAATVGAFPLPAGSADSALLLTLQPGAYTAQVSSADGASGVALVEVYQSP